MVKLILDCTGREKKKSNLISLAILDNQTPLARAVCHAEVLNNFVDDLLNNNDEITEKQLLVAFDTVARHGEQLTKSFDYLLPLVNWLRNRDCQATLSQVPHIFCRYNNVSLLEWFGQVARQRSSSNTEQVLTYMNQADHAGYTPLLTAVFYKSQECVQLIFSQMSSNHDKYLLATNKDHENILHICAKRRIKKDLFNIIWDNLLDTYKYKSELLAMSDVEGNVPLQIAARFNNEHMCNKLLNYIESPSSDNNAYVRLKGIAAHEASEAGHLNILKRIIWQDFSKKKKQTVSKETKSKLQITNKNEYTCLHLAAAQGHKTIVNFLVYKAEIDIDAIGDRRLTSLHLACEKGHIEVIQVLLQAGASTTLRNAQVYNCLEIAIVNQHEEVVKELFKHSTWTGMMRNAQPIKGTEAFDTPMRKLIRYMPNMAVWLINNNLTSVVGGPGQHVYKTTYDYEFYEDMCTVKDWYAQDSKLVLEPKTCTDLWRTRGVEGIHTCWCCCYSSGLGCRYCRKAGENEKEGWYTNDAYTLVRNHPLFIVSQQWNCPELVKHVYHTHLYRKKLFSFGFTFFIILFFLYMIYLALFTSAVLMGKHPKFFYDKAEVNMTLDLSTCEYVSNFLSNHPNVTSGVLKTETYNRIKFVLYVLLFIFMAKNLITISALFPKVFRVGGSYIEISALILSYVYIFDWFDWQIDVMFRCPVQYQLGAMGLLIGYINVLVYLRISPIFRVGIYVVMFQVISVKFLSFLPVLLVIICGFGFTYWMLLQYQTVYGTPIEALMRTSLMLFDLGYEDRLYDKDNGGQGYYKLVYVIFMLTAIVCSIFVINLLIALAVGEIPTLITEGKFWRIQMLYNLLSDYEILRIRLVLAFDAISCNVFRDRKIKIPYFGECRIPWFRPRPYSILEKDGSVTSIRKLVTAWKYTTKHFFHEQIQDNIEPSVKSTEKNN